MIIFFQVLFSIQCTVDLDLLITAKKSQMETGGHWHSMDRDSTLHNLSRNEMLLHCKQIVRKPEEIEKQTFELLCDLFDDLLNDF